VLVDGGTVLADSWEIALYCDRRGSGSKLIPTSQERQVREWTELADATSSQGRALVVGALLGSDAALDEGLPFPVPRAIRPLLRPTTRFGLRWFARKYELSADGAAEHENKMRPALDRLEHAIKASPYLLGAFSYADIAMATVLQGIAPVGNGYIRLGPATRRAWTRPVLEQAYPNLIRWRDNLYLQHRGRAAS
jgi:glutathione S-transferase